MLIRPYVPTDKEFEERQRLQVIAKNRETGQELKNEAFSLTVVENPLKLVSQFLTSASVDKYLIMLRDRIIVAHANTYDGIMEDWHLIESKVNYKEIIQSSNPNKVQAIIDAIENLVKEQKKFKKEVKSVAKPSEINDELTVVGSGTKSDDEKAYQGDTESKKSPEKFYRSEKSDSQERVVEEIFENQRRGLLRDFSPKLLLYTDKCGPWSTRDLLPITKDQIVLHRNWVWDSEWMIDKDLNSPDDDGWRYAIDWNTQWSDKCTSTTFVRRRRWVRERVYEDPNQSTEENIQTQSPTKTGSNVNYYEFISKSFTKIQTIIPRSLSTTLGVDLSSQNSNEEKTSSKSPTNIQTTTSTSTSSSSSNSPTEERNRNESISKDTKEEINEKDMEGKNSLELDREKDRKRKLKKETRHKRSRSFQKNNLNGKTKTDIVDVAPRNIIPASHTIGLYSLMGLLLLFVAIMFY